MNILSVFGYLFIFLGIASLGYLFSVFIFWWAVVVDGDVVMSVNGKLRFVKSEKVKELKKFLESEMKNLQ